MKVPVRLRDVSTTVAGAPLKSVLTLLKAAPAFTPAYQPVQLSAGAGAGGGALTAISPAKADPLAARMKPAPHKMEIARLLI